MRRAAIVVFALAATYLAVSVAPVSAASAGLAVGSRHTTTSDFAAGTLVDTTAENDSVVFTGSSVSKPTPAHAWNFEAGSGTTATDSVGSADGSISGATWSSDSPSGSYSLAFDGASSKVDQPGVTDVGDTFTLEARFKSASDVQSDSYAIVAINGHQGGHQNFKVILQDDGSGGLRANIGSGSSKVKVGHFDYQANTWYHAFVTYDGTTLKFYVNGELVGQKDASISTYTTSAFTTGYGVSDLDSASDYWEGKIDAVQLYDSALSAGEVTGEGTGEYTSTTHTAGNVKRGWANLSLTNTTAAVEWQGYDGNAWQTVNQSSHAVTGNYTANLSGAAYSQWRVQVSFTATGENATGILADEGVLIQPEPPTFTGGASPANGSNAIGSKITFSIGVDDPDFTAVSDTLTATFRVNGLVVGTDTTSSAGVVSTEVSGLDGGPHSWSVTLSDSYGYSVTSATRTFSSPFVLHIYDGANNSELLKQEVNLTASGIAVSSSYHMETTVTNGTVALSQFPEESIYLRLNTTGYRARQLMLVNPFATSNRYTVLYPENSSSTFNQCFSLDNQGAGFAPDRSWLLVRAHFDGDWRTVAGGYFGPTNRLCVDLQDQTEYRLVVQDNDDRRSLGGYVAEQAFGNQVIPLPVKGFQLSLDRGDTYRWEASASKTDSGGQIIFKFDSRETTAKNLDVRVYEQGNESNQLDAASVPGTIDQNSMSFNLTEDQTATRWVVAWNATVDGAPEHGQSIVSAELGGAGVDLGLSDEMQNVAIGGSVILVGGLFGAVSAPIGAVVLAGYGGLLFLLGLLDISSVALFAALGIAAVGFAASHFGGAR